MRSDTIPAVYAAIEKPSARRKIASMSEKEKAGGFSKNPMTRSKELTAIQTTKAASAASEWAAPVKHACARKMLMANSTHCIPAETGNPSGRRWRRVWRVPTHRGTCDQATASFADEPVSDVAMRTAPETKVQPVTPMSPCRKPLTLKPIACRGMASQVV